MQIIEYFEDADNKKWIDRIEQCPWNAARLMAKLLKEDTFYSTLGGSGKFYIMIDGEKVVSFLALTKQDCIADEELFPWIGFVFTALEYRGHRYSEQMIKHACAQAKNEGHKKVYLATDHVGFYEKYGFTYMENRIDVYGDDSRIYYKVLE